MYFFIVPALSCPASCTYCNGPQFDTPIMDPDLAFRAIIWAINLKNNIHNQTDQLNVTFHGGEPLIAGGQFYSNLFRKIKSKSIGFVNLGVQSNLWLLTEELCDLFRRNNVAIGTSLDGPASVTNKERCEGYYEKTMAGLETAKRHSIKISAIATLTKDSAKKINEILYYFAAKGIDFSANAAVPRINSRHEDQQWILPSKDYRDTMIALLGLYLDATHRIKIDNIDRACRALLTGHAHTCVFTNCLGRYIAVDTYGLLYPCMRFVGHQEYSFGNVTDNPDKNRIENSSIWKLISHRYQQVRNECIKCIFWNICQGGCPYNWLAEKAKANKKDPYCAAYKGLYHELLKRSEKEIFSKENRKAIFAVRNIRHRGILQRGPVLELMTGQTHADNRTMAYRRVIAAALLGTNRPFESIVNSLINHGISRDMDTAIFSLNELKNKLRSPDHKANDIYLHITEKCSGKCKHCYSSASNSKNSLFMNSSEIVNISLEAAKLGYDRIILTGGEPIEHLKFRDVLMGILKIRERISDCFFVLRTSFLKAVSPEIATLIDNAVHQVVVSLDGSPGYHDSRRFPGAHQITVENLKNYLNLCRSSTVRLAALVDASDRGIMETKWVYNFARSMGINSVVVRHPRPIGRAIMWVDWEHQAFTDLLPEDAILRSLYPRSSCGRGTNLHIECDGRVFPCYASLKNADCLGRYGENSISDILRSPEFRKIFRSNVDNEDFCRLCNWRYLCGGICIAWEHAYGKDGFNKKILCEKRQNYARKLFRHSLKQLGILEKDFCSDFNYLRY